jgi:hypothetical protein
VTAFQRNLLMEFAKTLSMLLLVSIGVKAAFGWSKGNTIDWSMLPSWSNIAILTAGAAWIAYGRTKGGRK